jgi:hypothetical protein
MRDHLWAKTPWALITDPHLTPSARRVYDYLDVRAGRRGWWYGMQEEIKDALSIDVRTVRRAVKLLREQGYIETLRTIEHRTALRYFMLARLDPDRAEVANPPAVAQPATSRTAVRADSNVRSDRAPVSAPRARQTPLPVPTDHATEERLRSSSSSATSARARTSPATTTVTGTRLEQGLLGLGIDPPPGFGDRFAGVDWAVLSAALDRTERGGGRAPLYFELAVGSELRVREHARGRPRAVASHERLVRRL